MNFSQSLRDTMPFDIYCYQVSQMEIFERMFYDDDDDSWIEPPLDIDPESFWFQLRLWISEQKQKLKELGLSVGIITGIGVVLGIIVVGLVGYQYTQSYVAEKGAEKARGN